MTVEVDEFGRGWYLTCMRALNTTASMFVLLLSGCSGGQQNGPAQAGAATSQIDPEASSFEMDGLTVNRPEGWKFVAPDYSIFQKTLAILQGPAGSHTMAPVVEIGRYKLNAAAQRRNPTQNLTTLALEMIQVFAAFDATGQPEDITVAGKAAAMLRMNITEQLPDGASAERLARFYSVPFEGDIWMIVCLGPTDESAEADFDEILGTLKID